MATAATILTVAKITPETEQMRLLTLKSEQPWLFIPGQVAVLGIEGVGEAYMAIASAPEDKYGMDFLVKDGKGAAAALFRIAEGAKVAGKGPIGKGFPVDNYKGRDILITAVGSAISPMRGVIRHIIAQRGHFGKVTLIYGVRFPAEFPLLNELKEWGRSGINVILTVSKPEGTNWTGKTGHVNAHYAESLKGLNNPVALICGMKAMQEEGKVELAKLGITPTEILTNY